MCLFLVVQRCLQKEGNDARPHRFRLQNPWWPGLNLRLAHSRLGDRWADRPRGTRDEVLADYPNLETKDIQAPHLVDRCPGNVVERETPARRGGRSSARGGVRRRSPNGRINSIWALTGVFDLLVISPFL
jgi:hypothetical protein